MSDYLTQLVARSLAMTPVVQPRSTSLFGPEQSAAQPLFAPEPFLETTTVEEPLRRFHEPNVPAAEVPHTTTQKHADQPQPLSEMVSAGPRRHFALPFEPLVDGLVQSEHVAPHDQPAPIMPQPLPPPAAIQPAPESIVEKVLPRSDAVPARPDPVSTAPQLVIEQTLVSEASDSAAPRRPAALPPKPIAVVETRPAQSPALQPLALEQTLVSAAPLRPVPSLPKPVAPRHQHMPVMQQPLLSPAAQPVLVPTPQPLVIEDTIVSEPVASSAPLRPVPAAQIVEQRRVVPAAASIQPPAEQAQSLIESPFNASAAAIIQPVRRITPAPMVSSRRSTPATIAAQPAASPPTIHVSIGRIEVRATLPPSREARSKSASLPTLSLNDYLRERNGGRR